MNIWVSIGVVGLLLSFVILLIVKAVKQKNTIKVLTQKLETANKLANAYSEYQKKLNTLIGEEKDRRYDYLRKSEEASRNEDPNETISVSNDIINSFNGV